MRIVRINDYKDIYNTVKLCSYSFYDQKYNSKNFIEDISVKFKLNANFIKIVDENDDTIGFAAYYSNDIEKKQAFLSMIIVRNEFACKGAGSQLLKYIIDDCKFKKMKNIVLEVSKNNEKAISFYKKFNFVFQNETENSYFMKIVLK